MSIIIKKKPKYNKKKIIQRVIALIIIYFTSFFLLYAFFGGKQTEEPIIENVNEVFYKDDGEKYLAEKNYFSAIEYYKNILSQNPEDFASMTKLAIAYKNIQDYDKAKFYAYKSKTLAPYYPENFILAAEIYILQKEYYTAERTIDLIPLKTKNDFIKKANLLVMLANNEENIEDKIMHYISALKYYKKYDKNLYEKNANFLIDTYFDLIAFYRKNNNIQAAIHTYPKIKKLKDDCITNNKLAKTFLDISTVHSIKALSTAVKKAETQEEKRLTRETIINFKYHYEKTGDNDLIQLMNTLLDLLDESTILVNEAYMPYSIAEDKFSLIENKKGIYPQINFKIKNQTENTIFSLYAKLETYINSSKILDSKTEHIIYRDIPLKANTISDLYEIKLDKPIDNSKVKPYIITLSLSKNGTDWFLYRIYKSK